MQCQLVCLVVGIDRVLRQEPWLDAPPRMRGVARRYARTMKSQL